MASLLSEKKINRLIGRSGKGSAPIKDAVEQLKASEILFLSSLKNFISDIHRIHFRMKPF